MYIKIGSIVYETDFQLEDLLTFYKYGYGTNTADKINDGGRYFWSKRTETNEKIAGSNMAIVPIGIINMDPIVEKLNRSLEL